MVRANEASATVTMTVDPQDPIVLVRALHVQDVGPGHLIDAVHNDAAHDRRFWLFFRKIAAVPNVEISEPVELVRSFTIGDAPALYLRSDYPLDHVGLKIDGETVALRAYPEETGLFAGLRTAIAIRNGESAAIAHDWLDWHCRRFGMEAALIFDRAPPGSDEAFVRDLETRVGGIPGLKRVVVVHCDLPLGVPDLPHEAHPFNVPGAPGKDRMEVPPGEPWSSPLDHLHIWELLRHRFLDRAASVANLELHDLIRPGGDNPFARAEEAGAVTLAGRQVYPWRVREDAPAHYKDHICVQFDAKGHRSRWAIAPGKLPDTSVWRPNRVVGANPDPKRIVFYDRYMAIRHEDEAIARIVPKSSLIEDAGLLHLSEDAWGGNPVRMPDVSLKKDRKPGPTRTVIVTCMKNEGPFILEWLAFHRAIGVTDVLVYTNDCDDGTDTFLDLLQEKGFVQHRDNPFRETGQKPQHAALAASDDEPCVKDADWAISMDVDEFINVKVGDGTLGALYDALPGVNLISCTWRLFGNSDVHEYRDDESLLRDYTRCAREFANKPHQAWGFKTLFQTLGIFKKMGVHRPKGLNPQLWRAINWVNGSGKPLPPGMYRNAWRSTSSTYGYDMVQLNHYAVRSAESFLVKRDRGRVNHVDRDQGLAYWFRMNNNGVEDRSIQNKIPLMEAERARLLSDPDIRAAHEACVAAHRAKIDTLRTRPDQQEFYATLTGPRMERLSRMHGHFGQNVFLGGPDTVPDDVVFAEHDADFFFTVEDVGETQH